MIMRKDPLYCIYLLFAKEKYHNNKMGGTGRDSSKKKPSVTGDRVVSHTDGYVDQCA